MKYNIEYVSDTITTANLFEGNISFLKKKFSPNTYLIVVDKDTNKSIFYFDNKKRLNKVNFKQKFSNPFLGDVVSKNVEQACLVHSLENNMSIVLLTGGFGTGKSFLGMSYAVHLLEKGDINKIVFMPNNHDVKNSKEIGFLPGSTEEKLAPYIATFRDIIGSNAILEDMLNKEKLEILNLAFARGRNLEKCLFYVNEAQNLSREHIELLLGRCANGSRVIFDGDVRQIDAECFEGSHNGLQHLCNLRDSEFNDMFISIKLKEIERGRIAKTSKFLSEL